MHKVIVDRHHAMVSMTASGFLSEADVAVAATDLHAAIRSLGDRAGKHVTLYDLTGLDVATAAVVAKFAQYFTDPAYRSVWAVKVALASGSPLVRMQMNRVPSGRGVIRVFDDRNAAIAWLLADRNRLQPAA